MCFLSKFHRNGKLSKGINTTFLDLIHKVENSQRHADFQPISFVDCMYKVLAKVLANKLRKMMGSVLSEP